LAIYGLIQAVAYSAVQDCFRAQRALKRGGGVPPVSAENSNTAPAMEMSASMMERHVLLGEIERVLKEVATRDRDRCIFWLHYRQGLSTKAISQIPSLGLSAKGVASIIRRLTDEVRRRLIPPEESSGRAS
jgi:RNA polymerase sigma-70 factor, ECF subfamily